ncbi:hypothetical protein [Streptomyces atratus]|uniref:hypothetical protein n=1 Tax=Streptomyces atratus TaxID=1893 RepID=UPI0018E56598|nr:hypothetical protein [Streptomyces atratus]
MQFAAHYQAANLDAAGITSKMIIDATNPVALGVRSNFSTPAKDLCARRRIGRQSFRSSSRPATDPPPRSFSVTWKEAPS